MSANGRLCSLRAGGHGQLSGASGTSAQVDWTGLGSSTYRFPATSSTCSSAVWASSGGSMARRLSLRERTLSATQPPISGGSTSRRFRSTLRLVSLVSFPREWGRAWPEGGRVRGQQKLAGSMKKGDDSPSGQSPASPSPFNCLLSNQTSSSHHTMAPHPCSDSSELPHPMPPRLTLKPIPTSAGAPRLGLPSAGSQ